MSPVPGATNSYAILGIRREANAAEIRDAYRKLALACHPDMVGEAEKVAAAALSNRFTESYEILQDEGRCARYDRLLDQGVIPDMGKAVGGAPPVRGIAEILGEIQSLDIEVDEKRLLAPMDARLRTQTLMPSLLRGEAITERVIDVVRSSKIRNLTRLTLPQGTLSDLFCPSFLYMYPKDFTLVEAGRARARHSLRVEHEEGAGLEIDFPAKRVPRLL
ncbi:J domain-containing protein [Paludisphaera borealis]|uniref:Chaperone protein DnaJ n=1 Tax=Paludisphaera borealis TaxID=1387353 RepID=A0A1U7CIZ9_9BACT|nr:J domain-containing protein [Paludisphaera borealis]APW58920.1 Chaperone protein DnaJ [Paludisphaera borealis]